MIMEAFRCFSENFPNVNGSFWINERHSWAS
jgi:hypothetical protein